MAFVAHRANSAVVALAVAAATTTMFATVGQSAAQESSLLATLERPEARIVSFSVEGEALTLQEWQRDAIVAASEIEWLLSLGDGQDFRPRVAGIERRVPVRTLSLHLSDNNESPVQLLSLRPPVTGDVYLPSERWQDLGFEAPSGPLQAANGSQAGIAGRYVAPPGVPALEGFAIQWIASDAIDSRHSDVRRLAVLADSTANVEQAADRVRDTLSTTDAARLRVSTSSQLTLLRTAIDDGIGDYSRVLAAYVAIGSASAVAFVAAIFVVTRRRDISRRRALGASRGQIIALICCQTAWAVATGVLIACAATGIALRANLVEPPPVEFLVSSVAMIVGLSILAALPPAAMAAVRDPLRALRVA